MKRSACFAGVLILVAPLVVTAQENVAEQYQDGTGLQMSVTQLGSGNYSLQRQEGDRYDTAETRQSGTDNQAVSIQTTVGEGRISIDQAGANNQATVVQQWGASGDGSAANGGYVTQEGAGNVTTLTQEGAFSYITSLQQGNNNQHTVRQEGYLVSAQLESYGSGNVITVGALPGSYISSNGAIISQAGDSNGVTVWQGGSAAEITVTQQGNGNAVESYQRSDDEGLSGRARIAQDGSNNQAILDQTGYRSLLESSQVGTSNRLTVQQQSNSTRSTIIANVTGSDNSMDVTQSNLWYRAPNSIDIAQEGNNLIGVVAQVEATGSISLLTQEGAFHNAHIQQTGISNQVELTQSGLANTAALMQQ